MLPIKTGTFIDKGNLAFQGIMNSDFVDKSVLIEILNDNIKYIAPLYLRVEATAVWQVCRRKDDSAIILAKYNVATVF